MSLFTDMLNNANPETEAKMRVIKARQRILDKIQVRVDRELRRWARWHKLVEADSHDWLNVTDLSHGQMVFALFKERTPLDKDLWEDAKIVFPKRYAEFG